MSVYFYQEVKSAKVDSQADEMLSDAVLIENEGGCRRQTHTRQAVKGFARSGD
jgi:hypothetical protein